MNLKIPFCGQKTDSACCGPCCLTMLAKYFKKDFTKNQLIKICKTDKNGTTYKNMNKILTLMGLKRIKKVDFSNLREIYSMIKKGYPILSTIDDYDCYHYTLISGFDKNKYTFYCVDPYYGHKFPRTISSFKILRGINYHWFIGEDK